ncbi:hypothetical protein GLOIN_2v1877063 [Rhizophagus irregularis DAOM 181602=DAOM 197198]|nr:hypothetical protein GLOIN_2v1877063 [Rhizophagus irregularis DAOM 181602=DAOM 197198]
MLRRFNSVIQARKLIVMNETGMSSGEWHRFNGHLKSLITEGKVSIERKGLETKRLKDFAGYMITSNQDAPIKIDIGDSCVVCFEVSACCRSNIPYFDQLGEILDHPDAPGMVMTYFLNLDLSKFSLEKIPNTKMKDVNKIAKLSSTSLYQHYLEWCEENGEKPLTNNILGQKFAQISIDKVRSRDNGVRVNQYILGRSKIVAKLRKSGLGDMEEFSDISQDDLPENETADIPIFNVPEIIPPKIIPTLLEKNTPPLNTSKDKKADKKSDVTQDLFDYVTEQTEAPVASTDLEGTTSGTSETSKTPESPINKPKVGKPPESNESSNEVVNLSPKETNVKHDSPKPNEVSSAILLARQQREERLRKKAVELGENPDAFVTITEKDRFDSITFRDRMVTDSRMCAWAIELEDNSKEHMDMTIRERLIGEEIICCSLEEDEIISSWLDTDKKWKKTYNQTIYILPNSIMAGIATKYVTENGLNNEISIEELIQHAPEFNILLTDKVKRNQARRCLQKGYNFSKE